MDILWAPWRSAYVQSPSDKTIQQSATCFLCVAGSFVSVEHDKSTYVLMRSKYSFAMLNAYPYSSGHVLIAPYSHRNDYSRLESFVLMDMMLLSQKIIRSLESSMSPDGFNCGFNIGSDAGAGVPEHLHYHIVPRWRGDVNFMTSIAHTKVLSTSLTNMWDQLHQNLLSLSNENQ